MKRIGIILGGGILLVVVLFGWWVFSRPERGTTGSVSTHFRWLSPNDKIVIDGFRGPQSPGRRLLYRPGANGRGEGRLGRGGGHE